MPCLTVLRFGRITVRPSPPDCGGRARTRRQPGRRLTSSTDSEDSAAEEVQAEEALLLSPRSRLQQPLAEAEAAAEVLRELAACCRAFGAVRAVRAAAMARPDASGPAAGADGGGGGGVGGGGGGGGGSFSPSPLLPTEVLVVPPERPFISYDAAVQLNRELESKAIAVGVDDVAGASGAGGSRGCLRAALSLFERGLSS